MGRHHKGVAVVLAALHQATIQQRQFEDWAATLPDDDKRRLFRQW